VKSFIMITNLNYTIQTKVNYNRLKSVNKMENKNEIISDPEFISIMDKWQVEMPDQQFFVNLAVVVQQEAMKKPRPWWSTVFAPMPVTSFLILFALAFGITAMQSRISADRKLSLTAANWASEHYGWSNIDEALEALAEENPVSQDVSHAKYLSTLRKGTYLYGPDNAAQMIDDLSETEMEYLLSEMQNTRS